LLGEELRSLLGADRRLRMVVLVVRGALVLGVR
jgi:hypothetical protein